MTLDQRAVDLARIVVNYSLSINSDDRLLIIVERAFDEFAQKIGEFAGDVGANVVIDYRSLQEKKSMIERADAHELQDERDRLCALAEAATAAESVGASTNPLYLQGVDPEKIGNYQRMVEHPFKSRIIGDGDKFVGIKWNVCVFPSEADAKLANMSLSDYTDLIFNSTNLDWQVMAERMGGVKSKFDNAQDVRILVPGQTDLHLSLAGRGGQIDDGKLNLPGGEIVYGPVENSANGYIYFPYSSIFKGNEIRGIRLEFEKGTVVAYSAEENLPFLKEVLDSEGMRRIGELGIGDNPGIIDYIRNLSFDEKIGGTIHLALGKSYPFTLDNGGGLNKAKDHWDLVCDLRQVAGLPGGELYVDDNLVQRNGLWLFK